MDTPPPPSAATPRPRANAAIHRGLVAALGVAALATALWATRADGTTAPLTAPTSPHPRVRVARVQVITPTRATTLHGTTRASEQRRLAFTLGGRLVARVVDVGARVDAGAIVARLDPAPLEHAEAAAAAAAAAARAQARLAQTEASRAERLVAAQAATDQQVTARARGAEQARAAVRGATAQLAEARRQRGEADLVAPFAGTVVAVAAEVGEVVGAGQPIVVVRSDAVELDLAVPPRLVAGASAGASLVVSLPEIGATTTARVQAIITGDGRPGALATARLVLDPGPAVVSGLRAEVDLVTAEAPGLLVPFGAVDAPAGRDPAVWLVADGRVRRVPVVLRGATDGGLLIHGPPGHPLADDAQVVVEGGHRLLDGDAVEVLP